MSTVVDWPTIAPDELPPKAQTEPVVLRFEGYSDDTFGEVEHLVRAALSEPPPPAPDKKAIADAIKAGTAVPGAHVETRQNLQIK